MFFGAIVEVAIGLVFSWLVLSATTMQFLEWIGGMFNWRAKHLERAVRDMFKSDALVQQFYNHPFILELYESVGRKKPIKPSYIPDLTFAAAAFDVFMNAGKPGQETPAGSLSIAQMRAGMKKIQAENPELGRMLKHLLSGIDQRAAKAEKMIAEGRANIETWFNQVMDETSRKFKKDAQKWSVVLGLVICLAFNVDSINITNKLWQDPTIREALVAQADNFVPSEDAPSITEIPGYFSSLAIPVGWITIPAEDPVLCKNIVNRLEDGRFAFRSNNYCGILVNVPLADDTWGWVLKFLGIGISAVAAMQGAPLWFDILKRLIGIKSSITPSAKSA